VDKENYRVNPNVMLPKGDSVCYIIHIMLY